MTKFLLLLLLCHFSSPVRHSLKFFFTASSGIPNFPEYEVAVFINGELVGYCNNKIKTVEIKPDWAKALFKNDPRHLAFYTKECVENGPYYFKSKMSALKERFNQTGGVHILQRVSGCEWDDETGAVYGFNQYAYDGEDFIAFDLKTLTWVTPRQQAVTTKLRWNADIPRIKYNEIFLTEIFPGWLKKYVEHGRKTLLRTELPSVFLLQKTPSSPVACHATGFYPSSGKLFWRRDGKELGEGVNPRQTLPNHDGTFQKTVELNLSSVSPGDWRRYDCVFHLSGVDEDIITKLDKAAITTNWVDPSRQTVLISTVVAATVIVIAAIGLIPFICKRKKAPDNSSEVSETLQPVD